MHIIAIANQKGGVGKTTLCASLSTELAIAGNRVLMIDADPQANLTKYFLTPEKVTTSLSNSLLSNSPLANETLTTAVLNLSIVPSRISLASFEREPPQAMAELKQHIKSVASDYDFILIDTPPHFGLLLSASLVAANYVLVPVESAPFALDGLNDLLEVIEKMRQFNENLEILGLLSTLYDARTTIAKDCHNEIMKVGTEKNLRVFDTIINRDTKLQASSGSYQPIQLYAPTAPSVERFEALAEEISRTLSASPKLRAVGGKKVVNE
jgi:chromosome partitioning protein